MITFGYISRTEQEDKDPIHYYFTIVEHRLKVRERECSIGAMKQELLSIKCTVLLILCEQFLLIDREIIDPGKDVHAYSELRKRIQSYIEWGHKNEETLPESIIQNLQIVASKYVKPMIDMISDTHPKKKELIFLHYGMEQNFNVDIEID